MSLSFLPRGVAAKRANTQPGAKENDEMQLDSPASPESATISVGKIGVDKSWKAPKQSNQGQPAKSISYQRKPSKAIDPRHLAVLIETSMSDYALWTNKDLRRYAADKHTKGFIALSRLIDQSALIQATGVIPSEAAILQALKDYGRGFVELQMKVINSGKHRQVSLSTSTYNIRRVDWESIRDKADEDMESSLWERTLEDWNQRTVYIENIPRKYWTLPSALHFIQSLSEPSETQVSPQAGQIVQHIELPAHAKASEGDIPVCKGFAFATFTKIEDIEAFIRDWPWIKPIQASKEGETKRVLDDGDSDEESMAGIMNLDLKEKDTYEEARREATSSLFKCMSFDQWNALKSEYLQRQSALYESIKKTGDGPGGQTKAFRHNDHNRNEKGFDVISVKKQKDKPPHMPPGPQYGIETTSETHKDLDYPPECLVFVKNLHPQTNKTALKTLFGSILRLAMSSQDAGVDYVDWSKGMSSCHIRLSHPRQAQALVSHLSQNPLVQSDGNDASGHLFDASNGDADLSRPLVAELVEGRAESIYWDKVPEKIKSAAIAKLKRYQNINESHNDVEVMIGGTGEDISGSSPTASGTKGSKRGSEEPGADEREKKRRRRA